MKLYNTLTRHIDKIEPLQDGAIGLYACGPTVYDFAHLGHLRKFTMDDVLVRTLRQAGYSVKFVQNITDVGHLASDADTGEDKMEKGAKKYNKTAWEVARQFEEHFFYSMDEMGNVRPDVSCRATEHIEEQLEMVKTLEQKGYTYVIEGDGVYFDTSKLDDYGKLARLDLEKLQEGARVEMIEGKRNPTDFALWKFEREGENRAMVWPSPWHPRSFPGWHIECSAMSMKYLGEQFDIHTGGIDHIPVHHTNEIAQAEAATGKKPFVRVWVHHNFLQVEGEKMSKSKENFFTIDDIKQKEFHPLALRFLFLSAHYRSEMNFTWQNLLGAQKSWIKLLMMVAEWQKDDQQETTSDSQQYTDRFFAALRHDLNTPESVAVLWEVAKSSLPSGVKLRLVLEFNNVLGIGLDQAKELLEVLPTEQELKLDQLPSEIRELIDQRQAARAVKDWARADELRVELESHGLEVTDNASGMRVIKKSE